MYTLYKGVIIELMCSKGKCNLYLRDESVDFPEFPKLSNDNGVRTLSLLQEQINNAFLIYTFAMFKGRKFSVDAKYSGEPDTYKLTFLIPKTENRLTATKQETEKFDLKEEERFIYVTLVHKVEIERMWEERFPVNEEYNSKYTLPFPGQLANVEEIAF